MSPHWTLDQGLHLLLKLMTQLALTCRVYLPKTKPIMLTEAQQVLPGRAVRHFVHT